MKSQVIIVGQQVTNLLDLCETFIYCRYSSATRQSCYQMGICISDEIIVNLEGLIRKNTDELHVGIFDFEFLAMLCTDKKWDIVLCPEDAETSLHQQFVDKFKRVRELLEELEDNVSFPEPSLCAAFFKSVMDSRMFLDLKEEVIRKFARWKREHLRSGSKKEQKKRLIELLKEILMDFLRTNVMKLIVPIKSEEELESAMNDLDFSKFEEEDVDYRELYRLFLELVDCRRDKKDKLMAYVPNNENLGRFVYLHWKELGEDGKRTLYLFVCQLNVVQEAILPEEKAEVLDYSEPADAIKDFYLPKCKEVLLPGYDLAWARDLVDRLMKSPLRDAVARNWASDVMRKHVLADLLGTMIVLGALENNHLKVARLFFAGNKDARSMAVYIGQGKVSAISDWAMEHRCVA